MAAAVGKDEEYDVWGKPRKAADDLYEIRDTFFPLNPDDKTSKLQHESDLALKLLDSIPAEQRKLPVQRATYEYLRGKILDAVPDYRKEAEDHLSKAVKLNPSLADAWLCLGNCIWKKGDFTSAKNCFNLALSKLLLILDPCLEDIASLKQGADNQSAMVEESIQHAKEAITLDVKDGYSWYNLGNACLTSFFVTGTWDHSKLLQSLKAYQNSEKDEKMKSNPDLYFNCATVNRYLENYDRALAGFEAAALKDPSLNASQEVEKMVNLLDKLENLLRVCFDNEECITQNLFCEIASVNYSFSDLAIGYRLWHHERILAFPYWFIQGHSKAKRLASSTIGAVNCKRSDLSTVFWSFVHINLMNSSYRKATIDVLSEGLNKAVAVQGKVLLFVKHENITPLMLACNVAADLIAIGVSYGLKIKEGDQLTLLDPHFRQVDFFWKGKCYKFKSIRVDFLEQVLVNGKALPRHQAIQTSIYAQHKP
ncbi:tetratricopeptide repeat protein 5-like isoform X1 [Hibiscus syriacus]|uniref:Tetratricopeptide repeat protein 5-like isoform X1 n=1 Tax=Hibiscus syriacus TaxID=106335 RepID=A0A6A2ZMI2_HIBSY|nr:tetratricopeptide repeat protein 5-like isoform X1 [Hibiscus syriacus]